jgi:hypothetical protein
VEFLYILDSFFYLTSSYCFKAYCYLFIYSTLGYKGAERDYTIGFWAIGETVGDFAVTAMLVNYTVEPLLTI